MDGELLTGLEIFDDLLYERKMFDQRGLLYIACTAKAKPRTLILARNSREENLNFTLVSGGGSGTPGGIFISDVIRGSRAEEIGLKRGDQILAVNGGKFERNITMTVTRAYELLKQSTHVKIEVRSCLLVLKRILSGEKIDEVDKNGGSQRFFYEERTDFEGKLVVCLLEVFFLNLFPILIQKNCFKYFESVRCKLFDSLNLGFLQLLIVYSIKTVGRSYLVGPF